MRQGWQWTMTSAARKQFERLDDRLQDDILAKLENLTTGAPNLDLQKLTGNQGYRLRVRTVRVIFSIDTEAETFLITQVADRKDAYR